MINNINQTLVALLGKNTKKAENVDTNTDAFQSLLAALMNQGMNLQDNNMLGLQGELQGQLDEVMGQNIGEMSTTDVFGMNPALMRMLSKLNGGTGDAQPDNKGSLKGFDELMKVFLSGKEQEPSNYGIDVKAVEDLITDLTQNKIMFNKEASVQSVQVQTMINKEAPAQVQGTVHDNMTITQEIVDSLTVLKDRMTQDAISQQSKEIVQSPPKEQGAKIVKAFEGADAVSVFNAQDNKSNSDVQNGNDKQLNIEVKAKIIEKPSDSQFIVTRPEILRILKGDVAKTNEKSDSAGSQNPIAAKTEVQDAPQSVIQNTELSLEMDSEEKKGEIPELKQDTGIQVSDIRSFQRVQDISLEIKHAAAVNKDDVINQVLDKIKLINGKDMSELHVSLKPESLGEVSIKLVMEKGAMTARIIVENSQVKSLIDTNLPQIKESLKNQNIDVASLNVSVNLGQGDNPNSRDFTFSRWTSNKRGSSRTGNFEDDGRIETVKQREVYTQRTGLNLLA